MSISIPGADYTPQLTGYTGQGAFRFWCQKVLPIVYDDSLSYYELLNKVVNYLNNVIADVANVEDNVGKLKDSYISLQSYVNEHMQEIVDVVNEYTEFTTNYFNNLDVQKEINTKLDKMASDGSLSALIGPIVAITAPDIITQWLTEHITPTSPPVDNTLTIGGAAADAKVTGDKVTELKSDFGSQDITKYIVSANGNYLAKDELSIDNKLIVPVTGALSDNSDYRCGYIRYPKPGTYSILQTEERFGNNYLYIPLFKADKSFYKRITGTSEDEKVVTFSISEEDAKNAPFIGVSMNKTDPYPMLLLDKTYPSNYVYQAPKYDFSDLNGMRFMGNCPNDLNQALTSGWYFLVSSSFSNVPSDYPGTAGCLIVMEKALNDPYTIQFLIDSNSPERMHMWYRYILNDGSSAGTWSMLPSREEINGLKSLVVNANNVPSLSGNYFDYDNAEWVPGIDTGSSFIMSDGFYHAFVKLQGPGNYIRVMKRDTFGNNCDHVCLFDKDKNRIKVITATRVGLTDGAAFTLTDEDAASAMYITMNYRVSDGHYYSGLYYNSYAYPLKAGIECPLPNYKPVSNPLYKCIFICDGDSIGEGVRDLPKALKGWWGRIVTDYSATGKNFSVGGGTITSGLYYESGSPRHWINASIDSIYSEYPELDYLILDGGTNDADIIGRFSGDTPPQKFGTWTDTDYSGNYDNETFCGAVETMFYKAINHWPRAKIGFIIAMQMGRDNNSSANRRRYFDEIKKIAIKWHIPVLDLWEESQMDSRLIAYYDGSLTGDKNVTAKKCYYDGQHPTSYGYDLMQMKIDAWINSL